RMTSPLSCEAWINGDAKIDYGRTAAVFQTRTGNKKAATETDRGSTEQRFEDGSSYFTISLRALRARARTMVRLGLAGISMAAPVLGLRPMRALVAGFSTRMTLSSPGMAATTPGPFLPICDLMKSV